MGPILIALPLRSVVSTGSENASQLCICQLKFPNRIFWQRCPLLVAEALSIEFVLPGTNDVTIHVYFLSLHITLLRYQDINSASGHYQHDIPLITSYISILHLLTN